MEKIFKIQEDKSLIVEITEADKLVLPGIKDPVGHFEQITIQKIKPENIKVLYDYVKEQKEKCQDQIDKLIKRHEDVQDVKDIPDNVIQACEKAISKGGKAFKIKMKELVDYIQKVRIKKTSEQGLAFLKKQMINIDKDFNELAKLV